MLKHSETIINSSVRRQDTTWDYRWDYFNTDDPNTIYLDPNMSVAGKFGNETWYFCGIANEMRKYDSSTWDPDHPVFEYHVDDTDSGEGPDSSTDEWDSSHPNNPTRYLRPGDSNFITITSTVQNVVIDPIPPSFVSDYGTEYLALGGKCDGRKVTKDNVTTIYSNETRNIVLEFKDEVGLDYKQFALYTGDEMPTWGSYEEGQDVPDNIIYYFDRKLEKSLQQDYVEKISFNATKQGSYQVSIKLNECWCNKETPDEISLITDILNTEEKELTLNKNGEIIKRKKFTKSSLNLIVWDLAGNYSIYKITRPFNTLSIDDLNDLVPVNILFTSIEPENFYIDEGIEGKIITQVYDPNDILWEYENVAQLTENSIGIIDNNSYIADDNREHNPLDGTRTFIITHLTESGNVEVEAWVSTGVPEIDELIKEKTYNIAICGPWIYGDEGRKYHIVPYIPKYLHGTEFADFVEFFQLYINTMYKSLESNRHISGLEKIARIGNFNDISRLEDSLVYLYANEFGNEFDFNVESLKNVNLVFNGEGFTTRDIKETFDIIKYVLEELPDYNRYKGTNTGMTMAIKMFGFASKIINIWVKKENPIEKNPDFIEEESVYSFEDYFMTSRFNLELNAKNNTFQTFCDNIEMFIDLVNSIKPITKVLNLIKYTIIKEMDIGLVYKLDDIEDENAEEIEYELEWIFNKDNYKAAYNIDRLCKLDKKTGTVDLFCLNYRPKITVSSGKAPSMCYNILGKYFKSNFDKVILKLSRNLLNTEEYNEEVNPVTYYFEKNGVRPILNSGSLLLYLNDASTGTNGYNMINKFFNFEQIKAGNLEVSVKMKFVLQPGTNYAKAEIPE